MQKSIYLIAYYSIKPKDSAVKTSQKGWMSKEGNVAYDEQITVATKLKTKDLAMAKIILDLSKRTVYRNSWATDKSFDDLFEHFYSGYQKYLDPVINQLGYEMVTTVPETPITVESEVVPATETISSS